MSNKAKEWLLWIVAGLLTAIEVVLPFFQETLPRGLFAAASGVTAMFAFIARLWAQQEAKDGD